MSAGCSALGSLDTVSYNNSFPAASFASGDTVTVSYTDDGGDTATIPPFASDYVLVQDAATTNLYGYVYYSSSKVSGLHSLTITSSQLTATGLSLMIATGTHIGTVAIRCTGALTAPTVANTATTVAANSSNNNVTLSITGTATSVAVVSGASHGTATASGTSIRYTPAAGYYGVDSFTYSAANGGGTSATATASITVTAPTITVAPATLPNPTAGVAYAQTLTGGGGAAAYTFAVTAGVLPTGLSLNASSGAITGTPAAAGNFNFTITTTDGNGFTGSQAYGVTVAAPTISFLTTTLPTAGVALAYSQTITASGGTAPYTYAITAGTLPAGMTLSAGGVLSGTPTAVGSFNLTVTATDSSGGLGPFSSSRNYTLTVSAATLSLSPATLPAPGVGVAYSQTLTATGGVAPYTYAVSAGTLPVGLTLSTATGVISGTPTASGNSTFTIQVTDSSTGTGAPFSATRAFSLSTGQGIPTAPAVIVGTNQNTPVTIHAAANATNGPFTSVVIVAPPASGTVAVQGLDIVYTPASTSSGAITFTYALLNAAGQSAPVQITVNVAAVPVPVASAQASASAGKVATVNITENATGGPFTGAAIVSVVPEYAGEARLSRIAPKTVASANTIGGTPGSDFVVTFTPAAAFAGTAVITYTISNAVATSLPAELQVIVAARRDPSTDPDVAGLINAQIQAARRFAAAQISNYNQRLEQLHGKGRPAFSNTLNVALPRVDGVDPRACQGVDGLVARDECQRGAARNRRTSATQPGAAASADEPRGNAPQDLPDLPTTDNARAGSADDTRLAFWTAGTVDFGFANVAAQRSGFRFTTGGVTAGADYRVSDQFTAGVGMGYGHDATDIGSSGTHSNADAFSVALYGSYRPAPSYFVDGVAGYGVLSFDSRRWAVDEAAFASGKRDGHQWFASLSSGYEHRDARWLISPYGRVLVAASKLDTFTESGAGINSLTYFGQSVTSVSGSLGLRSEYTQPTRWGMFTPFARVEYQHDFEGQSAANLSYADLLGVGQVYSVKGSPFGRDRFQVWLGGKMRTKTVTFGLDYNVMLGMSGLQQGVRLTLAAPF
nr:autotransporter domain-containing protein [uncultured Cupriavidus sp.]